MRTCSKCCRIFNLDKGENCDISAFYDIRKKKFYFMGGYNSCCDDVLFEVNLSYTNENDNDNDNGNIIIEFRKMFPFLKTCENIPPTGPLKFTFNDDNNDNCELSYICDQCLMDMIYKKEIRYSQDKKKYKYGQEVFKYPFYTDCCGKYYIPNENKNNEDNTEHDKNKVNYWMRITSKQFPYCDIVYFEDVTTCDYKSRYYNEEKYFRPGLKREPWFRDRAFVCNNCFNGFLDNFLILNIFEESTCLIQ